MTCGVRRKTCGCLVGGVPPKIGVMTSFGDLLGPQPVRLPGDPEAEEGIAGGEDPRKIAAESPTASIAWAALAEAALEDGDTIAAYAFARTGYHRGLDQLRKNGWKGFGPVPFDHEPNQGFLRCVAALTRAAQTIDEVDEYERCLELLNECDPHATTALGLA